MVRYAKIRIRRDEDFDGDKQFSLLLNDEEPSEFFGIKFFPDGFEVGSEREIINVHECHLVEQDKK